MKKLRPTKRSFVIVFLLVLNLLLSAQLVDAIPALVSYQGKVTDSVQNPLEGNYQMIFRLYETDGTVPIWAEEQTVHISNGIYTVYLGAGANIVGGDLAAALFSPGDRWLEVEIEGEVLSPRQQLTSVVYAFRAQEADFAIEAGNADTLDGLDSAQFMGTAGGQVQGDLEVKGILGFNSNGEEGTVGVTYSRDSTRAGVQGINNGDGRGVYGYGTGADGVGVYGESGSATGNGVEGKGYYGVSGEGTQIGVLGKGGQFGVFASTNVPSPGAAMEGLNSATNGMAVSGIANGENGVAVRGEATGANGTAVMATGDLFVGGAYKGNMGPNNGAPFPRPVFDSGTVKTDDDNPCVVLKTGLDTAIYNYKNFVIDFMQFSHLGYYVNYDLHDPGYFYRITEDNDIVVCQNGDWCCGNYFRARLWYYK